MSLGTLFVIIGLILAVVALFVTTTTNLLAFAVISVAFGVLIGSDRLIKP